MPLEEFVEEVGEELLAVSLTACSMAEQLAGMYDDKLCRHAAVGMNACAGTARRRPRRELGPLAVPHDEIFFQAPDSGGDQVHGARGAGRLTWTRPWRRP